MATFLFDEIIFGPVHSRRLGASLGVNLLPTKSKVCSFNCIYCECGWTNSTESSKLPTRSEVREHMQNRFVKMRANAEDLDVITFAGNGEPTLHPSFAEIIDDTIALRDEYFPDARIAVLSNSTMLHKQEVVNALLKVEQNILKLDSGIDTTIQLLNQPHTSITVDKIVEHLQQFKGDFTLQTMFLRGSYKGKTVDNTTDGEVNKWVSIVKELMPKEIMVYTIARDTPVETLVKVPLADLEAIADIARNLGIPVQVSG